MAKITAGILSRPSGKVAGVVGAIWKGIAYLRAYAIPSNPNSVNQQLQRLKFQTLQLLASTFLVTIMQKFWNPFIRKMSGYNHFIGLNIVNLVTGLDYNLVKMASGKLEQTTSLASSYNVGPGTVDMAYDGTHIGNGLDTDRTVGVVYDTVNKVGFVSDTGTGRSAAGLTINVGTGRNPADLQSWIFFYRDIGSPEALVSPSLYDQVV